MFLLLLPTLSTLVLSYVDKIPSAFISYIKYHAYKNKMRCSIYGLRPIGEHKQDLEYDCSDTQA